MNNRQNNLGEVVLYKTEDGKNALDVRLAGETVWLTQAQIANLFSVNVPAVSKHIKNIFSARELTPKATVSKMEIVRTEGKRRVNRNVEVYNLDMIISVGYRVNSTRATRFRIWATQTLKDHLIRGYTLNERRLQERGIEMEQAVQLLSRTRPRQNPRDGETHPQQIRLPAGLTGRGGEDGVDAGGIAVRGLGLITKFPTKQGGIFAW